MESVLYLKRVLLKCFNSTQQLIMYNKTNKCSIVLQKAQQVTHLVTFEPVSDLTQIIPQRATSILLNGDNI